MGICQLCLEEAELQRSHLIPRALYKMVMESKLVKIHPDKSFFSTKQIKQKLLCKKCETILNVNGERKVLSTLLQADESFALRDILQDLSPAWSFVDGEAIEVLNEPEFPLQELVHFAAGIVWKGSVASWKDEGKVLRFNSLGTIYNEKFRTFLLGESPFPHEASIWIRVVKNLDLQKGFTMPQSYRCKKTQMYIHHFIVPGVEFQIAVGKHPDWCHFYNETCAVNSGRGLVFLGDDVGLPVRRRILRAVDRSIPTKSVLAE